MTAKKKLIWAIDCDDVILPTAELTIALYNEAYGTEITLSAMYDENDTWGAPSNEEAIRRFGILLRSTEVAGLKPNPETIEALTRLAALDELHMVTGRPSFMEEVTYRMIEQYLPGVFQTVEHTNFYVEKGNSSMTRTKGEVCAQLKADVLLDDHVVHGKSVLESGLTEVIVWGDYPWNNDSILEPGMVKCVTWDEVFRERERILAAR